MCLCLWTSEVSLISQNKIYKWIRLGNWTTEIKFEYGNDTIAHVGCGVQFQGEFWYFGGEIPFSRQISKVEGCELVRKDDLLFDFRNGGCNAFDAPKPQVLLCFDYDHPKECFT